MLQSLNSLEDKESFGISSRGLRFNLSKENFFLLMSELKNLAFCRPLKVLKTTFFFVWSWENKICFKLGKNEIIISNRFVIIKYYKAKQCLYIKKLLSKRKRILRS